MPKKRVLFLLTLFVCSLLLCSCISRIPTPTEVWQGEVLGEASSLTLYSDGTCLMEISVETYDYRGTWKREDGFLILTMTAVHKQEGYQIPVGDMYFEQRENELICLIEGADEPLTFRRNSPAFTPAPPNG